MKKFLKFIKSRFVNFFTVHKSSNELKKYWVKPLDSNKPENYINIEDNARSNYLLKLIMSLDLDLKKNILELGCNSGRNLNHLFGAGFINLTGVEISKDAITLLENTFPILSSNSFIINKSIEDSIKLFKDNEFNTVFTMAVLEHIHPKSTFIFYEMVRITDKYLITIEDEYTVSNRHFPRNYKKIFESFGMKQIYQNNCVDIPFLGSNFLARIFTK